MQRLQGRQEAIAQRGDGTGRQAEALAGQGRADLLALEVLTSGLFRRLVPELFRQQDGPVSRINPLLPEERVPSGGGFGVYPKELCSSGLLVCVHNILISIILTAI